MSFPTRWYSSDQSLEFLLVVVLGVTIVSSAAWLAARWGQAVAAVRHPLLLSAVVCCLALPAARWLAGTADIGLLRLPIFDGADETSAAATARMLAGSRHQPPQKTAQRALDAEQDGARDRARSSRSPLAGDSAIVPRGERATAPPSSARRATALPLGGSDLRFACEVPSATDAPPVDLPLSCEPSAGTTPGGGIAARAPYRLSDASLIGIPLGGLVAGALLAWSIGTMLALVRLGRSAWGVARLRRRAWPAADSHMLRLLSETAAQQGMRHVPPLFVTRELVPPMAVGWWRGAIVVPQRLLGQIGDDQWCDIFAHELAHLARGDQRTVLLEALTAALYWPLLSVHALNRELNRAREELCDNVVLATGGPLRYGRTLLKVAELLTSARAPAAAVGIVGRRGELERRIGRLIDPRRCTRIAASRATRSAVVLLFVAGGLLLSTTRLSASATTAETETAPIKKPAPLAAPASEVPPVLCPSPVSDAVPAPEFAPAPASAPAPITEAVLDSGPAPASDSAPATERAPSPEPSAPDVTQAPAPLEAEPADGEADATITLRGTVMGPDGEPVAGARLFLNIDEWTESIELGRSDDQGRYHFNVPDVVLRRIVSPGHALASRQAALIATAEQFGAAWVELPSVAGGRMGAMHAEYVHDIRLVEDVPIVGRIVDTDGEPLADAVVRVRGIHELADPRWKLMHPAIAAGDPDLMTREQTDVNHWFTPLYPTAWTALAAATTDAEGRFRMAGVGGDRAVTLDVSGPGVWSASFSVLTREDVADFTAAIRAKYPRTPRSFGDFYPQREEKPEGDQGVQLFGPRPTVEVDRARTVAGIVRDGTTGEPVAGVRVSTAGFYGKATTDASGRYRILRVEDEESLLVYAKPPDAERYLTVVRRFSNVEGLGETAADFDLPRGVVIEGRVLEADTGRPIVSAPRYGCHYPATGGPLRAGYVYYFPLSTNSELRGAPAGLYFEGFPTGKSNHSTWVEIAPDGEFRIAVPPGPGVLLVKAMVGFPTWETALVGSWNEGDGLHRLMPYTRLTRRAAADDAGGDDLESFAGFAGPIGLTGHDVYHAYRVIDPPADATTLDLDLMVERAGTRVVRFVDRDGRPLEGVTVQGLVAQHRSMRVVAEGAQIEVVGLQPGERRELLATTSTAEGRVTLAGRTFVEADVEQPLEVRLDGPATISSTLLNAKTGEPLEGYSVLVSYPQMLGSSSEMGIIWPPPGTSDPPKTDAQGRFTVPGVLPHIGVSLRFREPREQATGPFGSAQTYTPDDPPELVLSPFEIRALDPLRIRPAVRKAGAVGAKRVEAATAPPQ